MAMSWGRAPKTLLFNRDRSSSALAAALAVAVWTKQAVTRFMSPIDITNTIAKKYTDNQGFSMTKG